MLVDTNWFAVSMGLCITRISFLSRGLDFLPGKFLEWVRGYGGQVDGVCDVGVMSIYNCKGLKSDMCIIWVT